MSERNNQFLSSSSIPYRKDDGVGDAENVHSSNEPAAAVVRPLYMDYNATTPLADDVLLEINGALRSAWGNPSSSHFVGVLAKRIINDSREIVAQMLGATSEDIIFTSGGTESNNFVIHSVVRGFHIDKAKNEQDVILLKRPHIITSNLEHDSIARVLQHFEQQQLAEITYLAASHTTGCVCVEDIFQAVRPETCLITIMLANNETGIIQPVKEIGRRLSVLGEKRRAESLPRIYLHTDAAQAIGKIPVMVDDLGVDFLTIVGHKFYGPRIGALYVRHPGRETPLYSMFYGGGQERNFRPGTENTAMIAGLGKACQLVTQNISKYESHMMSVRDYMETKFKEKFGTDGVNFNGKFNGVDRLPNTCNVSVLGSGLLGTRVLREAKRVQASVGAACHSESKQRASPILLAIGIPEHIASNAVRLSVGRETTIDDIDIVVEDIFRAVCALRGELNELSLNQL